MMFKSRWIELAETRRTEALCLLAANLFCGAYYLAGYAIECGLKACIATQSCIAPSRSPNLKSQR